MKLGLAITDLEVFKSMCKRYEIDYEECQDPNFQMQGGPVHATLTDRSGSAMRRQAYLVGSGATFKLVMDNDAHYSSIAKRIGQNGGKLTRDYAAGVIRKQVQRAGGMILSSEEGADGSIVMRASTI